MMLLMGMWMSLTKNPMKPMMAKPIAVAIAIFWNSKAQKTCHFNFTIPLLLVHLKWEI
jgi:hypothetical protein